MDLSFDMFSRVGLEDLALLTRQLATMISSGLSLMRALMVLESQTQSKRLKATVVDIRQDIESGASLSGALSKHPKIFSELYVAMIRAGETGGFLEDAMLRVAEQLEAQNKLQRQVKSAMVYPAVVSSIALCVVSAMLIFIIPVFAGVFKSFNGTMPSLTVHTIAVSNAVRHQWYFFLFGGLGLVLRLQEVEELQVRPAAVGPLPAQGTGQDRDDRPEDRPGPLGPHAVLADLRGRADARGDRRHRPHRRQHRRRERDGRRAQFGPGRRDDRQRPGGRVDLPVAGHQHGARRRGDRSVGLHPGQGRRLLRGAGGRRRQVADLDPRADHDRASSAASSGS